LIVLSPPHSLPKVAFVEELAERKGCLCLGHNAKPHVCGHSIDVQFSSLNAGLTSLLLLVPTGLWQTVLPHLWTVSGN